MSDQTSYSTFRLTGSEKVDEWDWHSRWEGLDCLHGTKVTIFKTIAKFDPLLSHQVGLGSYIIKRVVNVCIQPRTIIQPYWRWRFCKKLKNIKVFAEIGPTKISLSRTLQRFTTLFQYFCFRVSCLATIRQKTDSTVLCPTLFSCWGYPQHQEPHNSSWRKHRSTCPLSNKTILACWGTRVMSATQPPSFPRRN